MGWRATTITFNREREKKAIKSTVNFELSVLNGKGGHEREKKNESSMQQMTRSRYHLTFCQAKIRAKMLMKSTLGVNPTKLFSS